MIAREIEMIDYSLCEYLDHVDNVLKSCEFLAERYKIDLDMREINKIALERRAEAKATAKAIKDNIISVGVRKAYMQDMGNYSMYVWYNRCTPSIIDGLKPVQRRSIYAFFILNCLSKNSKKKSARVVGEIMGRFHPHGDSSIYGAFPMLTNSWECKMPLICYDSNSGSIQGGDQAAMRYTESFASEFCIDAVLRDLMDNRNVVDYVQTYSLGSDKEPKVLPVKLPLLLVNGTFGIAIGERVEVPKHALNDVIDATLLLLSNPDAPFMLIPDQCQPCEIIDNDWQAISDTGAGRFVVRAIIDKITRDDGRFELAIRSTPDQVKMTNVIEKINDMVKNNVIQIDDIIDLSGNEYLDIRLILRKGSDPDYVKGILYKNTQLQDTKTVNTVVMTEERTIMRASYREVILANITFRRKCIYRNYTDRLKKIQTKIHPLELYILILESGKIDEIIAKIRKNKSKEDNEIIEWLIKTLSVTDIQAKFIANVNIKDLALGKLPGYKKAVKDLKVQEEECIKVITTPELIDKIIKDDLLFLRKKYNQPRLSKIISKAASENIPAGTFRIILTEGGFVRKLNLNEPIRAVRGDNIKFITVADNDKDIMLFDDKGWCFKMPVSKIPMTEKGGVGTDIRLINKKINANIISVMYNETLKKLDAGKTKYYIAVVSNFGIAKKIDIGDIINAPVTGIVYGNNLAEGDIINSVLIVNNSTDLVIYTKNKALRVSVKDIPNLRRTAQGSRTINSSEPIDGVSLITSETHDIIVATTKGKFNRFSPAGLAVSSRGRAGSNVIKLGKGDSIKAIFSYPIEYALTVLTSNGVMNINPSDIPMGSSVSSGVKLTPEIISIKAVFKEK